MLLRPLLFDGGQRHATPTRIPPSAFEELEQAGRWTLAMAITTVTQRLVSLEVEARGEEAARSYLEGGLSNAAVNFDPQ